MQFFDYLFCSILLWSAKDIKSSSFGIAARETLFVAIFTISLLQALNLASLMGWIAFFTGHIEYFREIGPVILLSFCFTFTTNGIIYYKNNRYEEALQKAEKRSERSIRKYRWLAGFYLILTLALAASLFYAIENIF